MVKRLGLRLGFLALSVFAFMIGWWLVSCVFFTCFLLGYYRVCGITRNAWCGFLPYQLWSETKPSEYQSYIKHLKLRLGTSLRFLLFRETLSDISTQDSFQVNFSDFFSSDNPQSSDNNCGKNESEYSHLYGNWKEGNGNEWKLSK
jgi:hypothetical protein